MAEEQYVQEVRRFGRGPGRLVNPMRIDPAIRLVAGPRCTCCGLGSVSRRLRSGWIARSRSGRTADRAVRREPRHRATRRFARFWRTARATTSATSSGTSTCRCWRCSFSSLANQPRFRFRRTAERQPTTVAEPAAPDGAFRVSVEMWAIQYEERQKPTIIRTTTRKDLPSRGRFWIDPATGHVLMSELVAEDRAEFGRRSM